MCKKSLLMMLLMALFAPWAANAQETLTVYEDETGTNTYIPIYGTWADANQQSEFIIPAEELADIIGGNISKLTYHVYSKANKLWEGTAKIYLKEVSETSFETPLAYYGTEGATIVYEGELDAYTSYEMDVPFTVSYTYGGGNLLVGLIWTTGGKWGGASFYGKSFTDTNDPYTAIYSYGGGSISGQKFIPRVTFTYEPASTDCDMPTAIAVSDITPNGAQVTWEGDGTAWNLRYKASTDADYTLVEGLTTMSYTLSSLTENTAYSVGVQTVCSGSTSSFRSTSFTTANPCAAPTDLQVSDITPSSATLTWTAGYQETRWTVKYKKSTDETWTEEIVTGTPTLSLTGLEGLTVYNVQVYNCESYVSGSFTTAAAFPYAQDFSASGIPTGWTQYTGLLEDVMAGTATLASTSYGWSNGTDHSVLDGNHLYSNIYGTSCKKWIVTPAIPMESGARLTFDVAYTCYSTSGTDPQTGGTDDKFVVLASTDNMATWTVLRQWDNAGSEYVLNDLTPTTLSLNFDMADYAGTSVNIAFYAESTVSNADNNIHVDNVVFELVPSCERPTNLAVNYEGGTSATFTWTENGTATSWDLQYSTDAEFTTYTQQQVDGTPSFEITGLELATTYYVRVNAFCGTPSDYSNIVSFSTDMCMPENQCELTFVLTDSYGDSWNGCAIQVVDVATGIVVATMANQNLDGQTQIAETQTVTLAVCDGREIQFVWVMGSYPGEASWVILDVNGEEITSGAGSTSMATGDVLATYTVNCTVTNCRRPTDFAVSEIANHSAVLSWTENGEATEWVVEITDVVGGQNTEWNAGTNPFTLVGLAAETEYSVKVRPVCSDFDDKWSDAITFTTDVACPAPTNVAVSDVEPFAATVSWNGTAENYNLRYRVPSGFNYGFETAEAFVVDEFPPCTTYDGDGLSTYGINGYTMPNNTANYVGSVVSFNEYWDAHSGNTMGVFMDAIPSDEVTANDDYFILPALTIAAGDHFTFWARSVTSSYGLERMKVGVYAGNGTISSYFAGSATEYVEVPVDWTKYDYDLTDYVGQTIQLAINCVSADAFALLFDDIFVGDPIGTWDVTLNNVTSPYTLTELTDETNYEVQVQAACGGEDGVSAWTTVASFTTPSNCAAPTNLATNDITPNAATLSWEGFHDSYNLQYRTAESRVIYYFNDFNDQETEGWTFDGSWIYGLTDPIYNVAASNNYFMSMGWSSLEEETIISCELPAYESGAIVEFYYFAYQQANTFQIGYSTTTNDADAFTWSDPIDAPTTRYNLYQDELAAGVKYIAWKATATTEDPDGQTGNLDCVFIDDFGIFGETIPAGAWQTVTTASPYALSGLADKTEYEWQVQGINAGCDGGVTAWSHMATFTTLDACMTPEIDSVINIEATTATVYWTGVQDSYNVRYGTFVPAAVINFDDQVIPADWINDETYAWALTDTLTDAGYCLRSTNQGVASSTSTISFTATYEAAGVISFDAMFMGEGTSTYYDKCIFSIDGNQYFSYGAIGQAWYNMAYYFAAGTHTFTWTYSKDSSVNPTGDFFAIDNIKIQLHNDTWTTVENVTGNSYNMTGLTPESIIAVQVQGNNTVCNDGVTEWSSEYLFITGEQTTVTQTIELQEGTNWVSFYVDVTLDDLKAALVNALGTSATITIKSQFQNVKYQRGRWAGQLTALDMAQTYYIVVSQACEISFEGMPLDPSSLSITIVGNGNTWIAYPFNEPMSVTNFFAGFAINNDQCKSQFQSTKYQRGRWAGQLTTLEPGKGYVYISADNSDRTFTFPAAAKAGQKGIQKPMRKLSNQIDRKMQNAVKLVLPCK